MRLFVWVLLLVACGRAAAAEICVSLAAGDMANQTCSVRFRSLAEAAALAGPGDVIVVGPGTFRETLRLGSGTADKPIMVRSSAPGSTVLSGADEVQTPLSFDSNRDAMLTYSPPCPGCGQIFIDGKELPERRWPEDPSDGPFRKNFGHIVTAKVEAEGPADAKVEVTLAEPLPDWDFAGGRATVAQGEQYLLVPARIISVDSLSRTAVLHMQFPLEKLHLQPGNKIDLFPVKAPQNVSPVRPYWSSAHDEQTGWLHLPAAKYKKGSIEVKTRAVEVDLSKSSHVVIDGITVFAGAVRTADTSEDVELRHIRVMYGNSRTPTELTSGGWYVEGDREGAVELRGKNNRLLDSSIEDSMGNGVLVLGQGDLIRGNRVVDTNRIGLELGAISFGPKIGSKDHTLQDNTLIRSGRHLIAHRGLRGGKIVGNYLTNWGMLTSDTGGTYNNSGDCGGTLIEGNWIESSTARFSADIYLDDNSSNCVVRGNVALGADFGIWLGSRSGHHTVEDNFALGKQIGIGVYTPSGQQVNLNGSIVDHNQVFPRLQLGSDPGGDNRVMGTLPADGGRSLAASFADAHGFSRQARPQ